jgi:hypothetical protein
MLVKGGADEDRKVRGGGVVDWRRATRWRAQLGRGGGAPRPWEAGGRGRRGGGWVA